MDHDIEGLGQKIKELGEVLSPLSDGDWIDDWLKKVHGPGWTTLAGARDRHLPPPRDPSVELG